MGNNKPDWRWTRVCRSTVEPIPAVTLRALPGKGYLALSGNGIDWTFFSGPLHPDGRTLTHIGDGQLDGPSAAGARAVACDLPSDGVWRLPTLVDARYIYLGHTAPLLAFWPRRLVAASDT